MKRIITISIVLVIGLAACKTTKQAAQSPYTTDPTTQPKVFSVPTSSTETVTKKEEPKTVEEKPVSMRKEQVSFTQQADRVSNEANSFFVIIGSFSQLENAKNYRETLLSEGFTPIILHSETGYYRVCVNSYKNEQEARTRVSQVRQAFPKYSDIWLLIKE
ncbi:SPOR domain-containing protein [Maribellus maritimus]|uniref:SPOR domain-containing protein n=1 Tax=Maribellus maritimus TaxID=2870838 RepID=UPI001EEC3E1B|nr:SPOR domain-containing protein [Maribellus maritimus]MCG6188264.1 SPOR domain-containing protein [Maribellus maritimus]